MVNFPTRIPDCDSHSPAVLDLFISPDPSISSVLPLPALGNSDHAVVLVSINFLSNSKGDALSRSTDNDHSRPDWIDLLYHLRNVPSEGMFEIDASPSAAVTDFCEWVQVGIDLYISLILNIKSGLIHLHGFQMLELLLFLSFGPTE